MTAEPRTTFEWPIYADATLAGLSVLVPLPFMDDVSEGFFRRRIPRSIARSRGVTLPQGVAEVLSEGDGWWPGFLQLPVRVTLGILKRVSRKLLYFLTIKDASEKLSHYWLRAFLTDYLIASGHADSVGTAQVGRMAMETVLEAASTPMNQVAQQVIGRARHIAKTVRKARGGEEDEVVTESRDHMAAHWGEFSEYLRAMAAAYDAQYQALRAAPAA